MSLLTVSISLNHINYFLKAFVTAGLVVAALTGYNKLECESNSQIIEYPPVCTRTSS